MKILLSVPYSHEVVLEDDGRHVLEVYCGGIATYTVREPMTPDDVAAFELDPGSVERIALQIQRYGKRQ